jgi:hypothetical protein
MTNQEIINELADLIRRQPDVRIGFISLTPWILAAATNPEPEPEG